MKQLNTARRNVQQTLTIAHLFATLPEKAEQLLDLMEDDENLIRVYRELRTMIGLPAFLLCSADFLMNFLQFSATPNVSATCRDAQEQARAMQGPTGGKGSAAKEKKQREEWVKAYTSLQHVADQLEKVSFLPLFSASL